MAVKTQNKIVVRKSKQELLIIHTKEMNLFEEWVMDRFKRQKAI